jgi:putative pyrroloquinoline-quinone-binding quinoprotein
MEKFYKCSRPKIQGIKIKNEYIKISLAIGIVFLFIVSSTIPMVIGYETETVIEGEPPTLVSDGPMDSAWPMFGHDARHTGRSPYSTAGNTGVEIWRFKTEGSVGGGPVVGDDGTVYFGDRSWYFYALYPDGTFKWKYRTGGLLVLHRPSGMMERFILAPMKGLKCMRLSQMGF